MTCIRIFLVTKKNKCYTMLHLENEKIYPESTKYLLDFCISHFYYVDLLLLGNAYNAEIERQK